MLAGFRCRRGQLKWLGAVAPLRVAGAFLRGLGILSGSPASVVATAARKRRRPVRVSAVRNGRSRPSTVSAGEHGVLDVDRRRPTAAPLCAHKWTTPRRFVRVLFLAPRIVRVRGECGSVRVDLRQLPRCLRFRLPRDAIRRLGRCHRSRSLPSP